MMRSWIIFMAMAVLFTAGCGNGKGEDEDADGQADPLPDPDGTDDRVDDDAVLPDGIEDPVSDDAAQDPDLDTVHEPDGPIPVNECEAMEPEWVFCSSFEEGDKSIWDDSDGNPDETNLLMEDPGPFGLDGNHVMRLRVPEGRGGADLVKVLPSSHDRAYARWYVMWEPDYDFSAPNHGGGLHAGSRDYLGRSDYQPDGDDWFGGWLEPDTDEHRLNVYSYYRGMYQDCVDPDGSCWGDHFPCMVDEGETFCEKPQHRETVLPPVMETGRWYCLEIMMDGATPVTSDAEADGVLDWWIDGVEIGPWDDLWLRTTPDLKITILWLSLFHHGDHSVEGVMLDNVVVSTERIGCI
jgi:hypothetical protein